MPRRATAHDLPAVSIVPLGPEFYRPDGTGLISDQLDVMVRKALAQREQVLLFLNRRGFATYVHCVRCGLPLKCSRCDITLTYHRRENLLRCHWCGEKQAPPGACPDCGAAPLRRSGVGTEKIAAELARRYPEARAARLDRDTVTTYHSLRETLERFGRRELDILVGTQMVAKGHDFPEVTIVGIINADTGLHFPDFRAAERTFQLITQVAGRAGRGQRSGRVVVQTFVPDHYAIIAAAGGDYDGFLEKELAARKPLGYPPFGRLVKIQLQGPEPEKVAARAEEIAALLRDRAAGCRVLGPAPAPIARVEGRHRYHVLLKSPSAKRLHDLLGAMGSGKARGSSGVDIAVDVDPQGLL
jgi:primosomal protein N' (replication factor Y)